MRGLAAGREKQAIADHEPPALDPSCDDAPIIELVDVLDRQPQGQLGRTRRRAETVQRLDQGRSLVPGHGDAPPHEVFAVARRDGDDEIGLRPKSREIVGVAPPDLLVAVRRVANEIHLVDDHHHLSDAE